METGARMTIKHSKQSAAGAPADPTQVGGDDWNADHVIGADGVRLPLAVSAPATPPTGNVQLYANASGQPSYKDAQGNVVVLQSVLDLSGYALKTDLAAYQPKLAYTAQKQIDASGVTIPVSSTTPAAPTNTDVQWWSANLANASVPAFSTAQGNYLLQPFLGRRTIGMWVVGASGTVTAVGLPFGALPQTSSWTTDFSTYFSSYNRAGALSTTGAGQVARMTPTVACAARGAVAGTGGFRLVIRFGCADPATVAGARTFVGLTQSPFSNVNPSTASNFVGVGTDAGDANLSIFTNDAAGTATKIPLGANFPDHTLSADVYELVLYAPPAASWVGVEVTRLNTGDRFRTTLTTDLPAPTIGLVPLLQRNNNTSTLQVQIALMGLYLERE